jgi:hypothetical protein
MEITTQAPGELVRVRVGLVAGDPERRVHLPGELPIRRVVVVASRDGKTLLALDSHTATKQGRALAWMPGEELELEGDARVFGAVKDAFGGRIDWHAPTQPPDQVVSIRFVTINGHRLT